MRYLKLFDNYDPNHYVIDKSGKVDQDLLDVIDTILLPITDNGYKFNTNIYDKDGRYNDRRRLEISIYVEGEDVFTEKSNIINGVEIEEPLHTLIDVLKKKTGNIPKIYVWDDNDYTYIDLENDTEIHGLENISDLKEDYAETDSIKIVVLLDS